MQANIKFDHNPYILEVTWENDELELSNNIVKILLKDNSKVYTVANNAFDTKPVNYQAEVNYYDEDIKYTFVFFNVKQNVPFIDYTQLVPSQSKKFQDQKLWYILITYIWKYIFISKRQAWNLSVEKYEWIENLGKNKIDNYMWRYDTIKSVVIQSLINQETWINKTQYSGLDIKDSVEWMNYADRFLADIVLWNKGDPKSQSSFKQSTWLFSFSSSLISWKTLDHVIHYYKTLIKLFELEDSEPLYDKIWNRFLQEINYEDLWYYSPYSLMFNINEIRDICLINSIDKGVLEEVLECIWGYYELNDDWGYDSGNFECNIAVKWESFQLSLNFNLEDIDAEVLEKITQVIVSKKFFTLNFTSTDNVVFYNGILYKVPDTNISDETVENICQAKWFLNNSVYEKGRFHSYVEEHNSEWSSDSIFYAVEKEFCKDPNNLVICGDLWYELADHIIFNKVTSKITLIHSKWRKDKLSMWVSQFQDIIWQATKNLDSFKLKNDVIFNKISSLCENNITLSMAQDEEKINICKSRIISDHTLDEANDIICNIQKFPNVDRELLLCINFFDKESFDSFMGWGDRILKQQMKNILARLWDTCSTLGVKYNVYYPLEINE